MLLRPSLLKYTELMIQSAEGLVAKLSLPSSGNSVDVSPLIEVMTLETVAQAAFG